MLDHDMALGALTGMVLGEILASDKQHAEAFIGDYEHRSQEILGEHFPLFAQSIDLMALFLQKDKRVAKLTEAIQVPTDLDAPTIKRSGITRVAVSVVAHHQDLPRAIDESIAQALCTFDEGSDLVACDALTQILFDPSDERLKHWRSKLANLAGSHQSEEVQRNIRALHEAIGIVLEARNFSECLQYTTLKSYLNNCFGPVLGQLAGAHFGISQIPLYWLELIPERKRFLRVADALYALHE